MNILSVRNVVKKYHNHHALKGVSFDVKEGQIFGLLGPNGAGKTSLIRIITTITRADEGEVIFMGEPLNNNHPNNIAYLPEERGLYKKMKVGEQLLYLARLKGMSKSEAKEKIFYWMKKFDIGSWVNKRIEELSKGMQQKIQFISTVLHEPKLMILDEPFSGLDPINTELIKNEIFELHNRGTTIIFSTHRMEQVEEFCDEIVLINAGEIILEGRVNNIKKEFKENVFQIEFEENFVGSLLDFSGEIMRKTDRGLIIRGENDVESNEVINYFIKAGCSITRFEEMYPSLNDVFIKAVNGQNMNVKRES